MAPDSDDARSLCNPVAKTPGGRMLRSPSPSNNHDLLPVLHGWPHVSRHVAGYCVMKIIGLAPAVEKIRILTVLQSNFAEGSALAKLDIPQQFGSPSLCFVFRSGLGVRPMGMWKIKLATMLPIPCCSWSARLATEIAECSSISPTNGLRQT